MNQNMEKILAEKYAGSTVIREDANGIVLRNSSGGIEKVSELQAHNYSVTQGMRDKQANLSALSAQAKATVQAERQANRQAKADAQAAISKEVAAKRAQRDNEHDAFTKYGV